jgi:hypothetical protein
MDYDILVMSWNRCPVDLQDDWVPVRPLTHLCPTLKQMALD